MIHQVKERKCV